MVGGCTWGHISGSTDKRWIILQDNVAENMSQVPQKTQKWGNGKKLFNLSAIITSLYRVITSMTLRHHYVIMSHLQRVSHNYIIFLSKTTYSHKKV